MGIVLDERLKVHWISKYGYITNKKNLLRYRSYIHTYEVGKYILDVTISPHFDRVTLECKKGKDKEKITIKTPVDIDTEKEAEYVFWLDALVGKIIVLWDLNK